MGRIVICSGRELLYSGEGSLNSWSGFVPPDKSRRESYIVTELRGDSKSLVILNGNFRRGKGDHYSARFDRLHLNENAIKELKELLNIQTLGEG